jgi:beta-lactamase superfamily II metal-dependent hydrolase
VAAAFEAQAVTGELAHDQGDVALRAIATEKSWYEGSELWYNSRKRIREEDGIVAKRKSTKSGAWLVRVLAIAAAAFLVLVSVQEKLGAEFGLPRLSSLSELWRNFSWEQPQNDSGDALLRVHFIDVAQGKSILIETPEQNVLIDAGEREQGPVVLGYLNTHGIKRLDMIVATHPHSDHIGGLSAIIGELPVGEIIMPDVSEDMTPASSVYSDLLETIDEKELPITVAEPDAVYDLGGDAQLTLLGPNTDYDDLNAYSVVSRLDFGANSFLFAGDATTDAERDMLEAGADLNATVLDVGHHGSRTSSGEDFLLAASPQIAVISCAEDNSYGHPHREVIERLNEIGAEILRTDIDGTVVITSDGQRLEVETAK